MPSSLVPSGFCMENRDEKDVKSVERENLKQNIIDILNSDVEYGKREDHKQKIIDILNNDDKYEKLFKIMMECLNKDLPSVIKESIKQEPSDIKDIDAATDLKDVAIKADIDHLKSEKNEDLLKFQRELNYRFKLIQIKKRNKIKRLYVNLNNCNRKLKLEQMKTEKIVKQDVTTLKQLKKLRNQEMPQEKVVIINTKTDFLAMFCLEPNGNQKRRVSRRLKRKRLY